MWSLVSTNLPVALTGVVTGIFPDLDLVILQDQSGNAGIRLDLSRFTWIKPQQHIQIAGQGTFGGGQASLLPPLLLDNDGLHSPVTVDGQIYLEPGMHPFQLNFFQLGDGFALKLEYAGPKINRQTLPGGVLVRVINSQDPADNPEYAPGVEYDYFEGSWDGIPSFNDLVPVRSGSLDGIKTSPRRRDINFAFRYRSLLQIKQAGEYHFYLTSDDGSQLFVQPVPTTVKWLGESAKSLPVTTHFLPVGAAIDAREDYSWGQVEGTVDFAGRSGHHWRIEISSEGSRMELLLDNTASLPAGINVGTRISAVGFLQGALERPERLITATLLVPGTNFISQSNTPSPIESVANGQTHLPVLTTAEAVRSLKRPEAMCGYPVQLKGIITVRRAIPEGILQDLTSPVYVFFDPAQSWRIRNGDYCEVSGVTASGGFANVVMMKSARVLGPGVYPQPLHPDYVQLVGGSFDGQWVELQGLVSGILDERQFYLTIKGGSVLAEVQANSDLSIVSGLSNAFVRVRGAMIPGRNEAGEVTKEVYIWVPSTACINVDQSASTDPFQASLKQVSELSQFEPNPNYHQFTRVRGQILLVSDAGVYFSDGTGNLRLLFKSAPRLAAGDLVEAVGLPDILTAPPTLIEATIRKIGWTNLPAPPLLDLDQAAQSTNAGRWVCVQGQLVNTRIGYMQGVLTILSGLRNLQAICPITQSGTDLPPIGSRVWLCGVLSGSQSSGETELLMNSLSDVTCLQLPPFWSPQHLLLLAALLAGTVGLAGLWIMLLRRTISKRTLALHSEIAERQVAEDKVRALGTQRALEAERTRIARNIHDDLGASVTKLSRLAGQITVAEVESQARLDEIAATSRQMVEALDETVWTVNPVNDSLPKLANYIAHFAEAFFHNTDTRCELDIPLDLPERVVSAEFRFNLLLIVKEALNNVLKHAHAQSVLLRLEHRSGSIELTLRDDGCGFDPDSDTSRSGLANLNTRVTGLGGQIIVKSASGAGTEIFITLPMPESNSIPKIFNDH